MIFFGGLKGLNNFTPEKLIENKILPEVYITEFSLQMKSQKGALSSTLRNSILNTKKLELTHHQNVFSFDFVALNYRNSSKNKYAFKLEGYDQQWIYPNPGIRRASYTRIPPGSYTFRVKASNDDGYWNEKGASIQVDIKSPWWLSILHTSSIQLSSS